MLFSEFKSKVLVAVVCAFLFAEICPLAVAAIPGPPVPTFSRDIEPRFRARCSHCHGAGRMRPDNFSDYATVVFMKDELVQHVLIDRDMPMGMRFDPASLALIEAWINAGQPQ